MVGDLDVCVRIGGLFVARDGFAYVGREERAVSRIFIILLLFTATVLATFIDIGARAETHEQMSAATLILLLTDGTPEAISPSTLLELAEAQIRSEQDRLVQIERNLASPSIAKLLNPALPVITYEWQTMTEQRPEFANDALARVFLSQDADWSFVREEPGYDHRAEHIIEAFVFSNEQIEDRRAEFVAQELAQVFRSHIQAVARLAPRRLHLTVSLPGMDYDFEHGAMRFRQYGSDVFADSVEILNRVNDNLPSNLDAAYIGYDVVEYRSSAPELPWGHPSLRDLVTGNSKESRTGGVVDRRNAPPARWRSQLGDLAYGRVVPVLALDRQLSLDSIAMPVELAEIVLDSLDRNGEGLSARVAFTVSTTELSDHIGRRAGWLAATLDGVDILNKTGDVVVSLDPSQFLTPTQIEADEAAAEEQRQRIEVPPVVSGEEGVFPLTAETVDLLIARHLPEAMDHAMLDRMMLARWEYENAMLRQREVAIWGDFFVKRRDDESEIADRPDAERRGEISIQFRRWTLDRAAALPDRIVIRYETTIEPGPVPVPSHVGGTTLQAIRSALAACLRELQQHESAGQARSAQDKQAECAAMEAAISIPPAVISFTGPFGSGIGPRVQCGSASAETRDDYCLLGNNARRRDLAAAEPIPSDIFTLDKLMMAPDGVPSEFEQSPAAVEIEAEVVSVTRSDALPPHPWLEAVSDVFPPPAGTDAVFNFDLRVVSARIIDPDDEKIITSLELHEWPDVAVPVEDTTATGPQIDLAGPDVLGIRIGMPFDEAEPLIREHMDVGQIFVADRAYQADAATGQIRPYTSARLYVAADGTEAIVLYDEPPAASGIVVGAIRQLALDKGRVTAASVFAGLRNKYGPEDHAGEFHYLPTLFWGEYLIDQRYGGLEENCLPAQRNTSYRDFWRTDEGEVIDPFHNTARASGGFPNLEPLNFNPPDSTRDCTVTVVANFNPRFSQEQDSINVFLFDLRLYSELFLESRARYQSGEVGSADVTDDSEIQF